MSYKHMDEAWRDATSATRGWIGAHDVVDRAVLTVDVHGGIRVILWGAKTKIEPLREDLGKILGKAADRWWTGDIWLAGVKTGSPVHAMAWDEGVPDAEHPERPRLLERHRNRGAWFTDLKDPVWSPRGAEDAEGPPVAVFYSFKGGSGGAPPSLPSPSSAHVSETASPCSTSTWTLQVWACSWLRTRRGGPRRGGRSTSYWKERTPHLSRATTTPAGGQRSPETASCSSSPPGGSIRPTRV